MCGRSLREKQQRPVDPRLVGWRFSQGGLLHEVTWVGCQIQARSPLCRSNGLSLLLRAGPPANVE